MVESGPVTTVERSARRYRVDGMDCASCARTVESAVAALEGAESAKVTFGNALLTIEGPVPEQRIEGAVEAAGYRLMPVGRRRGAETKTPFWRTNSQAVSTCAAAILLLIATGVSLLDAPRTVAEPLYLMSMVAGGWFVARAASLALRNRTLDMNVLMSMAALGAVGIGAYAEGAWVVVLFALGTTLEGYALDRSRRSVEDLMDLAPSMVLVTDGGTERMVNVEEVSAGSTFRVRPGERVALDGVITAGVSSVDEAPITGEAMPREKDAGDEIFAGSLNVNGSLTVRSRRSAGDSTLAHIAQLVEEAQGSKAPSERFVDRFARIYTPVVFLSALSIAVVPILLGASADTWIYRGLALLIVACPCSLVISIPVSVVSAIGGAARDGVLIKGGQALEDLARIRTVALDKTGTLTLGEPGLVEIIPLGGGDAPVRTELLRLVASLERDSEHPLGEALVAAARERDLNLVEPQEFEALPGRGVSGTIEGRHLWTGGPRLAKEKLGHLPSAVAQLEERGQTAIILGEGGSALAAFGLADTVRPEASEAVVSLRNSGLTRLVMLTGDNEQVANALAGHLGIAEWKASLLPADKLREVEQLELGTGGVVMVGDGINDAPALAAARVGVAMGVAGTDAAIAASDVALLSDDLRRLPDAVAGSQRALNVMRQNVIVSLVVKGIFVVLTPFGLITLVMAVAADMGISLLVTLNGLRLLRRRRRDS